MKTMLLAILATIVVRVPRRRPTPESYEWVAGEILPSEPGWAPRVQALLSHR
jgi:hypothetical protein